MRVALICILLFSIANSQSYFFREYENESLRLSDSIAVKLSIYPPEFRQVTPEDFIGFFKWKLVIVISNIIEKSKIVFITRGRWVNSGYNIMLLYADSVCCNSKLCWERLKLDDFSNDYWLLRDEDDYFCLSQYDMNKRKNITVCVFNSKWFLDSWFLDKD